MRSESEAYCQLAALSRLFFPSRLLESMSGTASWSGQLSTVSLSHKFSAGLNLELPPTDDAAVFVLLATRLDFVLRFGAFNCPKSRNAPRREDKKTE
jgi:hypothetical protein